jgi:Histidine kinase-, DNA gyrase B-, and HSP90-like ATPase
MTSQHPMEQYPLWQRTLGSTSPSQCNGLETLRQSFLNFRHRVSHLVEDIGSLLPGLTVHSITHLDQLWRMADEIAGPEYPINPAEAYVLGGAFLLHDSAHVIVAYPNRKDGIKATTVWKDLIAQRFESKEPVPGSEQESNALFFALRDLHAKQASQLPSLSWQVPGSQGPSYLIESEELRHYYGHVIGQLAESHHWNIDEVVDKFKDMRIGSPPFLGHVDWQVDALKLALLLRTSDAAHISADRAPWFLFALRQPQGLSLEHWKFQSRMAQPNREPSGLLRFSTGQPFDKDSKAAWWLAFDTVGMIDRELKSAHKCLYNHDLTQFAAIAVHAADDPELFARDVRVNGWEPFNIAPKIGNVPKVIAALGGSTLYGDDPKHAIRELIQNAADAVRAMRALDYLSPEAGTITVGLERTGDGLWLHVQDDGIGMSRYALREYLLDFGKSLWISDDLRRELPGLSATKFESVGKFGIGFFSVFMLGERVQVTTRRYEKKDDEQSDQWRLEFEKGLGERPMLRRPKGSERLSRAGTKVSVLLNQPAAARLSAERPKRLTRITRFSDKSLQPTVEAICPTLDIDLQVKLENESEAKLLIKANDWRTLPTKDILKRIDPNAEIELDLVDLIDQEAQTVIGRLAPASINSTATLTFQGIKTADLAEFMGVGLATNSVNLARSEAWPLGKRSDWAAWARRWAEPNRVEKLSRRQLVKIHALADELDLRLYQIDSQVLNAAELKTHVKDLDSVKVLDKLEYDPDSDDFSHLAFEKEFTCSSNVLLMPPRRKDLMLEQLEVPPIDYDKRIKALFQEAWGDFDESSKFDEIVGSLVVTDTLVIRNVTVFSRKARIDQH